MLDFNFCDAEATPVCHYGHKTMEFAVQFEVSILDHVTTIGFKAVIDVMQVNAGHFADQAIEYT